MTTGARSIWDRAGLMDLTREAVIVRDADGRVRDWNRAAEALYGWTRADMLGQIADVRLGSDRPATGGDWRGDIGRTTADGRTLTVEVEISALPAGSAPGSIETGRDVTQLRATQVSLEASEHRYRNLFQAMTAAFWEIDVSGTGPIVAGLLADGVTDLEAHLHAHPEIVRQMMRATYAVDVNDHTVALFGGGDRNALLRDIEPFWPLEAHPTYISTVMARLAGLTHFTAETPLRAISGELFHGVFTACHTPELIARGRLIVGVIDISSLKRSNAELEQSRARYRRLFQHMPVPLCHLDAAAMNAPYADIRASELGDLEAFLASRPDLVDKALDEVTVAEANEHAVRLLGDGRPGGLTGQPIRPFWGLRRDTFQRVMAARIRGHFFQEETQLLSLGGRTLDVVFAAAFHKDDGQSEMTIVGMVDVGDRVRAQQMLSQLQREFAHAARISMLGELTASLAHEVSQPLAAIGANAASVVRWLDRPVPDVEEALTHGKLIVSDATRAADIISRIRGMAAPAEPSVGTVDLNAVVSATARFLLGEARTAAVDVVVDAGADIGLVQGDRTQLEQVVANLVINAIHALSDQPGPRRVRITTATRGDRVECRVEDNGPGIAPALLDRLFESFVTTKPSGMGLGLPICRTIIQSHGGVLTADQPDREGARFVFTLPRVGEAETQTLV